MADDTSVYPFDEGFFQFWNTNYSMLPQPVLSQPLAGTKRDHDGTLVADSRPAASGLEFQTEHLAQHVDPRQICCSRSNCCPELSPCEAAPEVRPSKRRALSAKLAESTAGHPNLEPESEHPFPDTCYEAFCRGFTPCESPECAPSNVCCDPCCDQVEECADHCSDPECSKGLCPDVPCYCAKCCAVACPLGTLGDDCHYAHSPHDTSGTIYCFGDAPCHFNGYDYHTNIPAYNGYQCAPVVGSTMGQCNVTAPPSTLATPALSPGTYTSLGSTFSSQSSPNLDFAYATNCFTNTPYSQCVQDTSYAPLSNFQPSNDFATWNFPSSINTGTSSGQMLQPSNASWPPPNTRIIPNFSTNGAHDKLADLASAAQETIQEPSPYQASHGLLEGSMKLEHSGESSMIGAQVPYAVVSQFDSHCSTSQTPESVQCICKWQHAQGISCNQSFPTPEALHKHLKAAHVDSCTRCVCQWEGCESCDRDFKQRSKLSRHLLGHAGYRPYACSFPDCNKTFATNQAKDNHERTHTGDRPYVCPECGYQTTTHTQLYTHINALHEKKKRHKCRFCDFSCADSSNLSKHERTHQTLRPFRCPHEGCTFKPDCRWENLKRHLRRNNHCPELLVEGSEEYKAYREKVRRETEEWQKRNENNAAGGRRKSSAA